jgi:hypothetical protein
MPTDYQKHWTLVRKQFQRTAKAVHRFYRWFVPAVITWITTNRVVVFLAVAYDGEWTNVEGNVVNSN